MSALEELRGIVKEYEGGMTAVRGVNLKVKANEILTIVGPNGAGKTTLLRIMGMLDEPTSGKLFYKGTKVVDANRASLRKRVTMVFQKTVLFSTTVYRNVAYGLRLRRYTKNEIEQRVNEALRSVGMEGYADRLVKRLSGGEQQRTILARALVLEPELLLLDEPLANLDPLNAAIVEDIVKGLRKNLTIVHTTHDLFQATRLADRLAVMDGGQIVQVGTSEEILRKPTNEFVARFVGFENIFRGEILGREKGIARIDVRGLRIDAVTDISGSCTVGIRPDDIIVSKRPFKSSVRNVVGGKLVDLVDMGTTVKLRVDVKGTQFTALVTKRSFVEMKLKKGLPVYLSFKASSVSVM